MAKTPVGTTILGTTISNAGVTLTPGTVLRADPRILDQGISLHTGPDGAVQLTLQGLGIATTGQVLYSLASTLMAPVKLLFYLIPGHSAAAWESALLLEWGVI